MHPKLDELLVSAHPILYRDRNADMSETAMCWGFPGDGWFGLLWELSQVLEDVNNNLPKSEKFFAIQVKEKFGSLRFYISRYPIGKSGEIVERAIQQAEERSEVECESCGAAASIGGKYWASCLCKKCRGALKPNV